MKFAGIRAMLPIAFAALALAASGCDKAKDALADAAGIDEMTDDEKNAILGKVGWDSTKPEYEPFVIHKGFKLTEKFKGDLSKAVSVPVPGGIPEQGQGAAGNQRSLALVRAEEFSLGDAKYTRFRIITVARFDAAASELVIDGEKINQFIPKNKWVSVENGNQAGDYIIIEGKGEKGLAYLTGDVKLIKEGQTEETGEAVSGAAVFTSSSPFVTESGDGGKYFLTMLAGSQGTVFGFKGDIGSTATGTPTSTTKEIAYSGVLDEYKGAVDDKVGKLGNAEASSKSDELFTKANKVVTDFVDGWTLVQTDLRFKQPPQAKPATPKPATPPAPAPKPTPSTPPETPPAEASPVVRKDPTADPNYNVDLGCSGVDADGNETPIIFQGNLLDNYAKYPGWRGTGDVRISWDGATEIFGAPEDLGANYLDGLPGYCLISTGDSMYQTSGNQASYQPGPNGAGQISELWQKVNVPTTAKSIQFRVAFFSSEFPTYVGSSFNDAFYAKFDESVEVLAQGTLNDLAGGKEAAADCPGIASYEAGKGKKCGEWEFTKDVLADGAEFWDVGKSSSMPPTGGTMGCLAAKTSGDSKCYQGMIQPRIICKDLTAEDIGKLRTLRFTVADAGDAYYDSALAIDSIVFSTAACGDGLTGRMTAEPDSKARTAD